MSKWSIWSANSVNRGSEIIVLWH